MGNFSTYFPIPSSGGGGGGILKQHIITTSGTIDLTTLGIADGDLIHLFLVGGGTSGGTTEGGPGGNIWSGSVTIGTAGTATATIGAGGLRGGFNPAPGGATSISGGGITSINSNSTGKIPRGESADANSSGGNPSGTNAGFGQGGTALNTQKHGQANSGNGGGGGSYSGDGGNGGSGIIIIYYS